MLWQTDVCAHTKKNTQMIRGHFQLWRFWTGYYHIAISASRISRISGFSSICLRLQRARSRRSVGVRQRTWAFLIPTHPETFISGVGRGPRWLSTVQIIPRSWWNFAKIDLHRPIIRGEVFINLFCRPWTLTQTIFHIVTLNTRILNTRKKSHIFFACGGLIHCIKC